MTDDTLRDQFITSDDPHARAHVDGTKCGICGATLGFSIFVHDPTLGFVHDGCLWRLEHGIQTKPLPEDE